MILDIARRALAWPIVFDTYQSLIGAPGCHRRFIHDMVRPIAGERILDIGCGIGASLRYLPDTVNYVGVDICDAYIAKARARYGHRGKFICSDVTALDADALGSFDRSFSFGVLHHLSDDMAAQAIGILRRVVKPGGSFVSIDPCYVPGQHIIAKLLIDNDRGEHVRDVVGFERLVASLGRVRTKVHHDLLRIPYSQIVMWVDLNSEAEPEADAKLYG